jgi:hypothetical protein
MIFTVLYEDAASNTLTNIYLNASDKQAITTASDQIDKELKVNAHRKGVSQGDYRVFVAWPLRVAYTVDLADRIVRVFDVRRAP